MSDHLTKRSKLGVLGLSFGALGIVYGDIGTSPLYSVNEMFFGHYRPELSHTNILSLISLVIWSLIIVVAFKYVFWVLKADNEGEGGVFALFALLRQHKNKIVLSVSALLIIAAGLLFGDGIITPAISVLSAVEGLKVITPTLNPYVVPITIAILTGLFAIQSRGTHKIGKLFGPVILVWFFALAALGLREIISSPAILEAFNPLHAARAFTLFPAEKLLILLGSVMLVVTGGEALYADMGHFGALPIRLSWFTIVMPCLILNYLGQGAYLLQGKEVISDNLFYSLVPSSLLAPMVILASMATVIASQALISGAFSLTSQGIALGLLPRLKISHTHEHHEGQIYISFVNWSLFVGCVLLVIGFGSSAALASAYGLAVSGVMVVTTLSMILIARKLWNWSRLASLGLFVPLLAFDSMFLTANSLKFLEGGYVPLTIGLILFVVMSTWRWGRRYWSKTLMSHSTMTMGQILKLKQKQKHAFERSLLVLSNESVVKLTDKAPPLLELFIKRYASLPDHVISLTIKQVKRPFVDLADRYDIKEFENDHKKGSSLLSITANFGFLEQPDVEKVIADIADNKDLTPNDDMKNWIIYVARERFIGRHHGGIKKLRSIIYTALVNNASPAYDYYGLGEDSRLNAELVPVTFE
ncbi:MAG: KUP/HAK/KT family potassium transporter [Candidatus Saccharibacteria bacterium]